MFDADALQFSPPRRSRRTAAHPTASTACARCAELKSIVVEQLRAELRPIVEAEMRQQWHERHVKQVAHIYTSVRDRERQRTARRVDSFLSAYDRLFSTTPTPADGTTLVSTASHDDDNADGSSVASDRDAVSTANGGSTDDDVPTTIKR